ALQRIVGHPVVRFLASQGEGWIMRWPVHHKREGESLTTLPAIVGPDAYIVIWVSFTALLDLIENRPRILHVKHRQPPHLPIAVAWMGIISELDVDRPAIVQAVLYLHANLVVGQRWQEGKCSLGQMKSHIGNSSMYNLACGKFSCLCRDQ